MDLNFENIKFNFDGQKYVILTTLKERDKTKFTVFNPTTGKMHFIDLVKHPEANESLEYAANESYRLCILGEINDYMSNLGLGDTEITSKLRTLGVERLTTPHRSI